jgi:hypothetical protein
MTRPAFDPGLIELDRELAKPESPALEAARTIAITQS